MTVVDCAQTTRIPLRQKDGEIVAYALVDARDADLARRTWSRHIAGYAVRSGGKVLLHREILSLSPGDGLQADHINGDRLDCRRANLRVVTQRQNFQNQPASTGSSRFRGVSWEARRQRWVAYGTLDGRRRHVGYFATEQEAAEAVSAWRLAHLPFTNEDRRERVL